MRDSRRSPARDGGSLRVRLVALVLVPLVGVGMAAATGVGDRVGSVRAAKRAEQHIRSAAAVDAVRSAFQQEVLPALSATAARNPSLISAVSLETSDSTLRAAAGIIVALPQLRFATDSAVARLKGYPAVTTAGHRFARHLALVRARLDNPLTVPNAMSGVTSFLAEMAAVEHAQVAAATKVGIDAAGLQALHDVDLAMRAAEAAAQELALFSATQFLNGGRPAQLRANWTQAWGTSAGASQAVARQTSPDVAAQWKAVNATAEVRELNQFLLAHLGPAPVVSIAAMIDLITADGKRNHAYMAVLDTTIDHALAAGRAQRHSAIQDLAWIIAVALLVVAVSISIAVLIRSSITRPLDRLAEQATRISQGELTDVQVSGPSEVRTVARALSGSVASLRNIEAQAAAVAAGDLDSPVVRQALPGPLGQVVHASVSSIIDAINDRELAQRELAHRAAHDPLTELPNRAQGLDLIERALHRAQRSAAMTALLFVDLDHFKAVNDTFGHATGDEVLLTVARRMLGVVRDGDSVARLGGDEFVVLVENVRDEADVVRLAERLVGQVSAELDIDNRSLHIGASVGVAFCRDGHVDADRLLHEADAATYRAKSAGRGRVDVFDDGLRADLKERADLEQAIATAMTNDEFVLHYQAIIDMSTGATTGVEALIRWNRPGHGVVGPDHFIRVAEQSTLINDIGRWVLHEATGALARWEGSDRSTSGFGVAVNISGRHLVSDHLVADVADALTASGIDPHRLTIEVTETVLVEDLRATRNLQELRARGVHVAIDDFGTGFTSIGQLPRLPIDTIKIDRSFIASTDPGYQELVRLIVAAGHTFGLTVVAEGIEEEHQAARLRQADAEYGQGFLYDYPQPATATYARSPAEPSPLQIP
jgi:diguanylate cyclase (GGDEF)-like protein